MKNRWSPLLWTIAVLFAAICLFGGLLHHHDGGEAAHDCVLCHALKQLAVLFVSILLPLVALKRQFFHSVYNLPKQFLFSSESQNRAPPFSSLPSFS